MIELCYWPTPNGHKITMFLEETGLDSGIKPVDITQGDRSIRRFWRFRPTTACRPSFAARPGTARAYALAERVAKRRASTCSGSVEMGSRRRFARDVTQKVVSLRCGPVGSARVCANWFNILYVC